MIIGVHCALIGARDEDRAHQQQALEYFQRASGLPGQAWAYLFASHAFHRKGGDWAQAVTLAGQALALFRRIGGQAGQGWALTSLGTGHARLGHYELASRYARQALELGPQAGGSFNLAHAWNTLGFAHSRLGEHRRAIGCYQEALALTCERTSPVIRTWLADLLTNYGNALQAAGDLPAARQAWQQALHIRHDLHLPASHRIRARLQQVTASRPPG